MSRPTPGLRRAAFIAAAFVLSVLSCGREVTGPGGNARAVFARGLSFDAEFPEAVRRASAVSSGVVDFTRVRVIFRRAGGEVALDRTIDFPAGADSIELSLELQLAEGTSSAGEVLQLSLAYINAAGDTVFRGGPMSVTVVPSRQGDPPPAPFRVPVVYTGVGSNAVTVQALPETVTVVAGGPFAFTATARDAASAVVANAPISWRSLDATRALVTVPAAGSGTTTTLRGHARIVAELLTGGADTTVVEILPRAGSFAVVSGGGQTAPAATTLSAPIVVRSLATDGLPMGGVPLTIAVTGGGGTTSVPSAITDGAGEASFTWTLGALTGTQALTISSPGVANLVVNATATSVGPTQLVITQQPGTTQIAGATVTPTLRIEARDAGNSLFPGFVDSVHLAISANPGDDTLSGVHRIVAIGGVATFDAWHLRRAGVGYTITASATGLTSATTSAFTVVAAAADSLLLSSGGAQVGAAGQPLPQPIVVRVTDAFGNPVAGRTVDFAVATGSLSVATGTTNAAGLASVTWTLGAAPTSQALTATATGLRGSPLAVNATVGSAIVSTTVAPLLDTLTAIGATRALIATSRDAASAVQPGSYTWTSRDAAVATVSTAGLVTSVTNGATWIDVIEAGGTRDSSRIVVQQRLATIRVTPDPRSIYMGASFQFAAQAVDGLNVPLTAQPSFTWGTVSAAIATIDVNGLATGVGLGSTQVQATASSVTGVALLTVRTPITRIAVVRDSATFTATDTFTLTALARTRSYRAVAHDTLDAVMTGISFAWASSNNSVAGLDSTGTTTARAVAFANGITAIRASAQGVTGAAALTVSQVMTSIDLSPTTAEVAPAGSVVLTPRRRDANGFFIPGGIFAFTSDNLAAATVSASGVVTGVDLGVASVTATSGAITSNASAITVTNSVSARISFGRDTLAIGRSATNVAIPVYLSRPNGTAITVNLAVADTFAFFNPTSITIPAGVTVGTANLNGRVGGTTTRVFAVDAGATYAGDTAILAVQAGVRFTSTSYTLLVTDQLSTQVLLTDPSPAGGTFITYQFGTPGRANVSPDPAFIPFGQLAADVVITATAVGGTTITPAATGVNGTSSTVNTQAALFTIYRPTPRIGTGQFRSDWYVYAPSALQSPLNVTITSSDSTVASVTPTVTIPSGSNIAYFTVTARTTGTTNISTTAPGWTTATQPVIVTTPRVDLTGGGTLNTTSPQQGVTVYSSDSTFAASWRTSALAVQVSSTDEAVIRVLTPNVSIGAGDYFNSLGRVIPGGTPGTAWVRATASGHFPDSVFYTVVGPKLEMSLAVPRIGARQYRPDVYVYTPNAVTTPLVVRLTSSAPGVSSVTDSVVIPVGSNIGYFTMRGLTPGAASIIATATGYQGDTSAIIVTTPKAYMSGGQAMLAFQPPVGITLYSADSTNGVHYSMDTVIVALASTNTGAVTVTAADTILPGEYFTNAARVSAIDIGTAYVRATATGHRADSASFSVSRPKLQFSFATYRIGRRQYRGATDHYVYVPHTRTSPLAVTITQTNAPIDSLSATALTVPSASNIAYFGFAGLGTGVDTLIASAPGYDPDTAVVIVTRPRLTVSGLPGTATTTSPPAAVTVYVADSVGGLHYSLDTLLIRARSSNSSVVQPDSVGFRLPRGAYFVQPRVRFVGPGTANVTYADSLVTGYDSVTTNTTTVTGPSLSFYNGRPVLGMRQNGAGTSAYVTIPNSIGAPLWVRIVSTDSTVASVPDSVLIPQGQTLAYVDIRGRDIIGTVQIQATAVGYTGANVTQQVTAPRFDVQSTTTIRTTQSPTILNVFAADANGNYHYVNENVTVTLISSNVGAATVDSATVVIVAGNYYNGNARVRAIAPGTTTITASDARVQSYRYNDGSETVAVVQPNLQQSWGSSLSLGIGQWVDQYVYTPDAQPSPLTVSLAHLNAASTTPSSIVIPAATNIAYHRITGSAVGTDTITYTASGHVAVRGEVDVGLGRVDGLGNWPATLTADSVLVTLYARDPSGNVRYVAAATTFNLVVNGAAIELRSGVPASPALTSVTIPADANSVNFYVRRLATGTASVTITNANYTPHTTPIVTVP